MSLRPTAKLICSFAILTAWRCCLLDTANTCAGELDAAARAILADNEDAGKQIDRLTTLANQHPNDFSWTLHNALRHLYSYIDDPAESLKQCDIILSHSHMDGYVLSILSGWQLDKDQKKAIANLLRHARSAKHVHSVRAACWLQIGDLYQGLGDAHTAHMYYHMVLNDSALPLSDYQRIAEEKLGLL